MERAEDSSSFEARIAKKRAKKTLAPKDVNLPSKDSEEDSESDSNESDDSSS